MNTEQSLSEIFGPFLPWLILIAAWDAIWKLIALWRSARNNQVGWFICIAIFNTAGILPIIYLLTHRAKHDLK